MATEHVDIADGERHEPKGASTAAVDTVYVSDGAASGSWSKLGTGSLDTTEFFNINEFKVQVYIPDISTASSILIPCAHACTFTGAVSVLGGTIATSDVNISFVNAAAASMGTAMVVAFSGSAEGDVDTFTPTANNTISANSYMKISTDGASTNTVALYLELTFTLSE